MIFSSGLSLAFGTVDSCLDDTSDLNTTALIALALVSSRPMATARQRLLGSVPMA
jgi:hypothetical protein